MSERRSFDPDAGPWVAYRDEPARRWNTDTRRYQPVPGQTTRWYAHSTLSTAANPEGGLRYDTKAEALAAARKRWPRRVLGCRIGAEKVD